MKPIVVIAAAGLILLAGLAIGWQAKPTPLPTYRDVIVSDTVLLASAPDTVLSIVERIKWKTLEPTVIAHGNTTDLSRLDLYCGPSKLQASDSTVPPASAVLPPTSGRFTGSVLSLYATDSDGRLYNQEVAVTAPFQWVAHGGVYDVRTTRSGFKLFRALPKVLLPAAAFTLGVLIAK